MPLDSTRKHEADTARPHFLRPVRDNVLSAAARRGGKPRKHRGPLRPRRIEPMRRSGPQASPESSFIIRLSFALIFKCMSPFSISILNEKNQKMLRFLCYIFTQKYNIFYLIYVCFLNPSKWHFFDVFSHSKNSKPTQKLGTTKTLLVPLSSKSYARSETL